MNTLRRPIFMRSLLFAMTFACGGLVPRSGFSKDPPHPIPAATLQAEPVPLRDVRLLNGPFREAMDRDKAYLLSLDADRLLHNFRVTAGLPSSARPLGGWESPDCELRGHSVGHYLSACSLMYASTGDPELKKRVDYIVAELAKCQEALPAKGYNKGFLSAYPESFFDRVDRAERVWAPYYTLHKIMAGLLDANQLCGNRQALGILNRMADWLKGRVDKLSYKQMQTALGTEHGGMNEVLANLYAVTGNPDHLRLARAFNHEAVFAPLAAGEDRLNGLHANTQIPKVTGAAREYELTGERRFHDIATFFWERVALHRSYVLGGDSDSEHFFPTNEFAKHLTPETAETCNTYNMLKLTRHLFEWQPSARLMDFYERGLYNQILASQDPDSGMMTYFVPMESGRFKTYSTPDRSFWCCVGTGMENHAKYGDTIYFQGSNSLYVNLFIPSELNWKRLGVRVTQQTKFPEDETTTLAFSCASPKTFALYVRYPGWTEGMQVRVNGKEQTISRGEGSYVEIERTWKTGDKVEAKFPMRLSAEELPGDPTHVAVLYGPILLAGELGAAGMPADGQHALNQLDFAKIPVPAVSVFPGTARALLDEIKPVKSQALAFQLNEKEGTPEVSVIPFYRLHHERYIVYWNLGGSH